MNQYPITQIDKGVWNKKVNCASMYTIPAEDEALPVLKQIQEILIRLIHYPLEQTLGQNVVQYFFVNVFPVVCQKLIRSRYFKSNLVLKLANSCLENSIYIVQKYLHIGVKYPKFLEVLIIVFSTDEFYFKNNNQISYKENPNLYFKYKNDFGHQLQVGDFVDILKALKITDKVSWSRGQVINLTEQQVVIAYLNDCSEKKITLKKDSSQIAKFKTKSKDFQWRMALKEGDLVDFEDEFANWYNSTVVQIIEKGENKKQVKISMKVYHQNGPKTDENGKYFGFCDYEEVVDLTDPRLQPYCTIAKQHTYQSSKSSYDIIDDLNDNEFDEIDGKTMYAFPRKRNLSEFLFQTINTFGQMTGFDTILQFLEEEINFDVLCYFVKGISGIGPYLHRTKVKNFIQRLKKIIERHMFGESEKMAKQFTKEKSQMIFSGLRILQRRIYNNNVLYEYENLIKMKLVDSCLESQALKKKLQGLNQLKDIVRSVLYTTERNRWIKNWVKQNNIFEKVYMINSHVQLIKKSEEFFKYLINESILQVNDLERLYKMAQKGDYESRISLYKLFQEVSHIFKKQHVEYLIDTILESELNLILNEDIDLLHQLSRFSNYFPLKKVIKFFQNIILGENKVKELNDYAIKKYSEIVAKNYDMKNHRRQIIRNFLDRLTTHDITQITKVLKGIFEGIGFGDWGKKELNEILAQENVDQISILAIKQNSQKPQFDKIVTHILEFLLSIFKLSYKVKIKTSTFMLIWEQLNGNKEKQKQFYEWANNVLKCEQGLDSEGIGEEFEKFYRKLFDKQKIQQMNGYQFDLAKNLFIQINKKGRCFTVSTTMKDRQIVKECKRKVSIKQIKLMDVMMEIIFQAKDQTIVDSGLGFFAEIYTSKDNSQEEIDQFLNELIKQLKEYHELKDEKKMAITLNMIENVIDDSEKFMESEISSLVSQRPSEVGSFLIINELSYISQNIKKVNMDLWLNSSLINLRKTFGKEFKVPWKEIKVVANTELKDIKNSRTLQELKVTPNNPLTISRRLSPSHEEIQLVVGDQLNPKAIRCFKVIFEKYSTNGLMDKDQCNSFTGVCLGPTSSNRYYTEKIASLYNTYDEDRDGFLKFQQFLKFYEDAAKDRPSTVWSNLRSFDVKSNLRFIDEPEEQSEIQNYPRKRIAEDKQFTSILFQLLEKKSLAKFSFELLERLSINNEIQEKLLHIDSEEELNQILKLNNPYTLFYNLSIIQILLKKPQAQNEEPWKNTFIKHNGYAILFETMKELIQTSTLDLQVQKSILSSILKLLISFKLSFFNHPETLPQSLAVLRSDLDIDEKIEYLVTTSLPKEKSLNYPTIIFQRQIENMKIDNSVIADSLLKMISQIWEKISEEKHSIEYSTQLLIDKSFYFLNILYINEEPSKLTYYLSQLLEKLSVSRMVSKIYTLILCLCFYSQVKYQGIFIRQLFKNLTKTTITSQHFRVLAVLVSKFGISGGEDQSSSIEDEEQDKMRAILLENILKNTNELTVEGCAKLLCNFNLSDIPIESFYDIWSERLFSPSTICKKEQTKSTLYELIIKIATSNPQYINEIIETVQDTIEEKSSKMKINYCNQFKERSQNGFAGLKNLGNICYMNSMIQQMFMNKTFRYLLLRINDQKEPDLISVTDKEQVRIVDDNLLHQIQRIFVYLERTNRIDFMPRDFCVAYKPFGESVNVMIQQDVQEFVSMFFDRLQSFIGNHPLKRIVQNFYSGKTSNLFSCHECKKTKKVEENFHSITLQVKNSKTLADSFNRFILGEVINDFRCDFCDKKVDVTKRTRISTVPKILIIHLQRIVFNLDTFINQKISSKHSFPHDFNLHPYTLNHFDRTQSGQTDIQVDKSYDYSLIGIICHTGNAESGHYISYIKTQNNKWYEFNDSLINTFNPNNIQSECFGGTFSSSYEDEFDWDRKESSKSAYLLLYERQGENNIQLIINNLKEKQTILKELQLQQIIEKVEKPQSEAKQKNEENPTQSQEQSSQVPEDSEKEAEARELLALKELQIKRSLSGDNIEIEPEKKEEKTQQIELKVKDQIHPYVSKNLGEEVEVDNVIHFFEKSLSSSAFSDFFSKLMSLDHGRHKQLLPLCQKLTFGFWLKSSSFKFLLGMIDKFINQYPQGFTEIILENKAIITLLIEYSDADVRTNMASFLSKAISDVIEKEGLDLQSDTDANKQIVKFLDHLFDLLPTTVSKCWTKFTNYFQFWHQFSNKGAVQVKYMMKKQIIKHFMDYFLDTKSPLKIYAVKRQHQIGSSYTSPNFSMLLRCVANLIQKSMTIENLKLSKDEEILLMSCESIEKLIGDKYEFIATNLVKEVCPGNLQASEKVAFVLLKGLTKSNYDNIQPYLEVLHEFVLIEDEHQETRIKWVIGKETLAVSTYSKKIKALVSYSFQERLYNFDSTLYIEGGTSLLEMLFVYYKKIQNFSMLCMRELVKLCYSSQKIRNYVYGLAAPTFALSKYSDFFKGFINRYYEQSKRGSYGFHSSSGFNKEQLAKSAKEEYEKLQIKLLEDQKTEKKVDPQPKEQSAEIQKVPEESKQYEQNDKNEEIVEQPENKNQKEQQKVEQLKNKKSSSKQEKEGQVIKELGFEELEEDNSQSQSLKRNQSKESDGDFTINVVKPEECMNADQQFTQLSSEEDEPMIKTSQQSSEYPMAWHPVSIQYKPTMSDEEGQGIFFYYHESLVTFVQTQPTGFSNRSFSISSSAQKIEDRMDKQVWKNKKTETVSGFFVKNETRETIRIQTEEGCYVCKPNDSQWIWGDKIKKTWPYQRSIDWPKWSLFE